MTKLVHQSPSVSRLRILRVRAIVVGGVMLISLFLLSTIMVPDLGPHASSSHNRIINNLLVIENQKRLWAADHKKEDHETPTETDLAPYFDNGKFPESSFGEIYQINSVVEKPTATVTSDLKASGRIVQAGTIIRLP